MSVQDWNRKVLRNEALRVEVLPGLGGKVASLSLIPEGGEFLQPPLRPYAERTPTLPFDQADGSGWDECFPSVGACQVSQGNEKFIGIEDHGDLWRIPWQVTAESETSLTLSVQSTSIPVRFTRSFTLEGSALRIDYAIENHGDRRVPYGWSIHPLFAVQPFDRIVLPDSVHTVTGTQSAGRLGALGQEHPWPMTVNALDNEPLDLSRVGMIEDGVADKLLLPAPAEGWCALDRLGLRARLKLQWNAKDWPWLGLWLCYGGWPGEADTKKGYTVAIEPCNLPDDSLARSLEQGAGAYLEGGQSRSWTVTLSIERLQER